MLFNFAPCHDCGIYATNGCTCNNIQLDVVVCKCLEVPHNQRLPRSHHLEVLIHFPLHHSFLLWRVTLKVRGEKALYSYFVFINIKVVHGQGPLGAEVQQRHYKIDKWTKKYAQIIKSKVWEKFNLDDVNLALEEFSRRTYFFLYPNLLFQYQHIPQMFLSKVDKIHLKC